MYFSSYVLPNILMNYYKCTASCFFTVIIAYYMVPILRKRILKRRISPGGKIVLITGCDTGFGHLLAKKLDLYGFKVFASCLNPAGEGAKSLKESCSSNLHVIGLDVTSDKSVESAVEKVKEKLKNSELWAVVNNAGVVEGLDAALTPVEDFRKCLEVNTLGTVRVSKAFLPLLLASKGRIICVTSIAGRLSAPHITAYSVSKFAAVCFCESLKQELKRAGVKVISIEPFAFRTSILDMNVIKGKVDACLNRITPDIASMYTETYSKYLKTFTINYVLQSSTEFDVVINSLFDAITLEEPDAVYTPCGNAFVLVFLRLMMALPRTVVDFLTSLIQYMTYLSPQRFDESK